MNRVLNDFLTFLGATNGSGRWYLWWSGMFGNLTIFAGIAIFYRRHNCQVHRCLRLGGRPTVDAQGVQHLVCRRHHPDLGRGFHLRPEHLVSQSTSPARSSSGATTRSAPAGR